MVCGRVGSLPEAPEEAMLVVSRRIKPGNNEKYEDWLRRVIQTAGEFPGFRGVTTLAPEGLDSDIRYLIWRFDSKKNLDNWETSAVRTKFVEEVKRYADQHYESATGMETWFSVPDMHKVAVPPKWKMLVVTFAAAYLVSVTARVLLSPVFGSWSIVESTLVYTAILVGALTYFIMPWLSRLLRDWLYPGPGSKTEQG
jgi:uncharacterized protein